MKILDSHSALEVTLFEAAFSDPFMKLRNSMKSTAHLLTNTKKYISRKRENNTKVFYFSSLNDFP